MSDLHTTKSAARVLGVSEASVRRWSDAGLLPVQRVGRRRARRFAEEDLRAFIEAGRMPTASATGPTPAAVAGQFAIHEHVATFYDTDAARLRVTLPFLRDGLLAGELCVLVADRQLSDEYFDALGGEQGIDPRAAASSGALVSRAGVGSTAREAIAGWDELFWHARHQGAAAIRVVGEMASYEGVWAPGEMLDYEIAYDSLSKRHPVRTVCQYDVRRFDGAAVLGALKAHPDVFQHMLMDSALL
jgi:excisionase family DNA binding protein